MPDRHDGGQRRLYRARDGTILGVCAGIARYMEVSPGRVRLIAVVLMFVTSAWPIVGLYFLAAFFMPLEPVRPIESEEAQEFYNSFTSSRTMALHRLKRTFDRLDRRIRHMEDVVTDAEYDWDRRMRES